MPVIRHADARRTTTPHATMTTHASPTQGATTGLAMWTVQMTPGAAGPEHSFDSEQIWTILAGDARVEIDGEPHGVTGGDTLVLPAGSPRRVHAGEAGLRAVVATPAGAQATPTGGDPVLPPWIA